MQCRNLKNMDLQSQSCRCRGLDSQQSAILPEPFKERSISLVPNVKVTEYISQFYCNINVLILINGQKRLVSKHQLATFSEFINDISPIVIAVILFHSLLGQKTSYSQILIAELLSQHHLLRLIKLVHNQIFKHTLLL